MIWLISMALIHFYNSLPPSNMPITSFLGDFVLVLSTASNIILLDNHVFRSFLKCHLIESLLKTSSRKVCLPSLILVNFPDCIRHSLVCWTVYVYAVFIIMVYTPWGQDSVSYWISLPRRVRAMRQTLSNCVLKRWKDIPFQTFITMS